MQVPSAFEHLSTAPMKLQALLHILKRQMRRACAGVLKLPRQLALRCSTQILANPSANVHLVVNRAYLEVQACG